MVPALSLWLPILVAAVLVFVASSAIHMFLNWHKNDFQRVPDEDGVMDALREFGISPGNYLVPRAESMEVMKSEEFQARAKRGPTLFMTVLRPGDPSDMGKQFVQWFVYCLVVGLFAAYVTGQALGPGAEYMAVFKVASTTAFMGYALAHAQDAIWMSQGWPATLRSMLDGLIYGLVTGGAFGWLWP
ncbi:MAG: hypothetical protein OXE96_15830 [Gemmatimonadetes bacterium]|nr:hypothetical protein [Gemmatimonadota bacterium]